jgi:DNA segregation ATPase FtsK/SpoIIIE, S-DNA-T family
LSDPGYSSESNESTLAPIIGRTLREGALVLLSVLAVLLFLALVSFSDADGGFARTGGHEATHNLMGPLGAQVADVLLLLVGLPAFLLPLMLALAGVQIHFNTHHTPHRWVRWLKGVGFALTLASSAGLAALHFKAGHYPAGAGGILGVEVGLGLNGVIGFMGATLLLLALWFCGVAAYTGVSWFYVMDVIGALVLQGVAAFRAYQARRVDQKVGAEAKLLRQAQREQAQKHEAIASKRSAPKIETPPPVSPKSARVEREKQKPLFDKVAVTELPPLSLLDEAPPPNKLHDPETLEALSRLVEIKLKDFGVEVRVVAVHPGPVVTRFEMQPAAGVKVSQISGLSKDIARALAAISVRVVEVIPGKDVVGLEIPNEIRETVTLGDILRSKAYDDVASPLTLALGKDISGQPQVADLQKMPHLLIAGTTGSGKSVGINAMVLSLLYKATADEVRLIMIDPKMLELSVYEGIPHLLAPVVTDMKQAANALRWCVAEMDRRYLLMSHLGVRNIGGYNRKVSEAIAAKQPLLDPILNKRLQAGDRTVLDPITGNVPALTTLPYIVVVIDELADLMMLVGKKVEELIARLAQKARASGIHLILATQRPSVDVITGLIKSNIPTRMAFQVSAKVDSRTILDQGGAESLLGHGDMLFLPPGTSVPIRVHGAYVSDNEVHRVVSALKQANPQYDEQILEGPQTLIAGIDTPGEDGVGGDSEQDMLYDEAVKVVLESKRASVSGVQRRLKIGYNRAARLVEAMEAAGLVGPLQSNGTRELLVRGAHDE